eukprot:scaffold44890_cov60-Phaeocystis_antarctica.AAC.2
MAAAETAAASCSAARSPCSPCHTRSLFPSRRPRRLHLGRMCCSRTGLQVPTSEQGTHRNRALAAEAAARATGARARATGARARAAAARARAAA